MSFLSQAGDGVDQRINIRNTSMNMAEKMKFANEIDVATDEVAEPFTSAFKPSDMRQLALVAHNHMKPAMKDFIDTYSEVLKKFRITGTQTTMRMCKSLWGEDNPDVEYGLTCTSGPLGGDAQIAALMCMEDLGALIFFVDPLSAHPHQADIDSLLRLANCGNVIICPNPTSAMSMMHTLRTALEKGSRGLIPSFFRTLESPAVAEYKANQELALMAAVSGQGIAAAVADADVEDVEAPAEPADQDSPDKKAISWGVDDSNHGGDDEDDGEEGEDEFDTEFEYKPKRASHLVMPQKKKKRGILKMLGKSMRQVRL